MFFLMQPRMLLVFYLKKAHNSSTVSAGKEKGIRIYQIAEVNPCDLIKSYLRSNMQDSKVDGVNPRLYTKSFNSTPANAKYIAFGFFLPRVWLCSSS